MIGAIRSSYSLLFTLHVSSLLTLSDFRLTSCAMTVYLQNIVRILSSCDHEHIEVHHYSGTSPATEGLSGLYELLLVAGKETPVAGNQSGSYLTMKSNQGLVFGAATILSGFSGIFCDQGYWQRVAYEILFATLSQNSHNCWM